MLKIGITGGIGSGKSIVCKVFALLGVPVYDSDARAKWVMAHDAVLRETLQQAFGKEAYTADGQLDRAYLAAVVFNNPEKLALLNSLVHPRVRQDFTDWAQQQELAGAAYVLKEAALMYESEAWKQMDRIITVYAPLETRIGRVVQRDPHRTKADVEAIIGKQLAEEEKLSRAEHVIYNNDQQLVIPQVLQLHELFSGCAHA